MSVKSVGKTGRMSLFWRIYLYGMGLLLLVSVTAGIATHLARNIGDAPEPHKSHKIFAMLLAEHIQANKADDTHLKWMLDRLHTLTKISFTIFDLAGNRLAYAGSLKQIAPEPDDIPSADRHRFYLKNSMANLVLPLVTDNEYIGYALLSWKGDGYIRFFIVLAAVLAMLTFVPLISARVLTKPLFKITKTARAIGEGDLSARTGVSRSDEIGLLAGEVDQMAARIQHLVKSEKALMANISHEIRTPLARIRVLLELLAEEKGGMAAVHDHLAGLNADVSELEQLLEDVFLTARLDLSIEKTKETSLVLRNEPVDFSDMIHTVVSLFREDHPDFQFNVDLNTALPSITGDVNMLRRVIQNLLDNAVKYSDQGTEIEIKACQVENNIQISVCDRGTGIDEADIQNIFEPFYRGREHSATARTGVGIGRALCKRIVEAHGGTLTASNRPGGGTVFRVVI